jgi:4-amino-4-deoxy-L-arabinose transferase-like glycosyltransferase
MSQPPTGTRAKPVASLGAVAAVLAVVYVSPLLVSFPLLDPDEGLHATIAQEMVERGDYVTPSFQGKAFFDKPILYFWAQALSLRLLGMTEAAVRLPGLLLGLLGAVSTGLVAGRLFGTQTGRMATLLYATTILPAALAQAAAHDVATVPCTNFALLCFWNALHAPDGRRAARHYLAAGLFLGLNGLAKGLLGVAIVLLAFGLYVLVSRRIRGGVCLGCVTAMLVAVLVASPWYVMMSIRNPGYAYYFFIERHLLGYLTESQPHGQACWWYYLPILAAGGLPWVAYLAPAAHEHWVRKAPRIGKEHARNATVFVWAWVIAGVAFLSLAQSKLVTYLSPVFPGVAILAAAVWMRFLSGDMAPPVRRTMSLTLWATCLLGPVLLPVALHVVQERYDLAFSGWIWAGALIVAFAAWLPAGFWIAGRPARSLYCALGVLVTSFAFILSMVMPNVAEATSARSLADHFNRIGRVPPRLLVVEERIGSVIFYLDRELRAGLRPTQLQRVDFDDLAGMRRLTRGSMIAVPKTATSGPIPTLSGSEQTGRLRVQQVGHYQVYEVPNETQSLVFQQALTKMR